MSIVKTITNENEFYEWLKQSDSYKDNFSVEGARALQAYIDEMSEELEEPIEFDPIAWCSEWTEYDTAREAYEEKHGGDIGDETDALEWLRKNTIVITVEESTKVIVQDF